MSLNGPPILHPIQQCDVFPSIPTDAIYVQFPSKFINRGAVTQTSKLSQKISRRLLEKISLQI
jgi:hypothetical protein